MSQADSETDSGVDLGGETGETEPAELDRRLIRPDMEVISKLCNFDEEEEDELSEESEESDGLEDDGVDTNCGVPTVLLPATELRHIVAALVRQHLQVSTFGNSHRQIVLVVLC